jgi:predicted oxidoreductase
MSTGYDYSWFVLTQKHHQEGVRAVGLGAESRPHRQELADDARPRHQQGRAAPVEAFKQQGADFIVARQSRRSRRRHEQAHRRALIDLEYIKRQIEARDREIDNPYVKDAQVMNIHNARRYIGDR